jgi:hypothetical protein
MAAVGFVYVRTLNPQMWRDCNCGWYDTTTQRGQNWMGRGRERDGRRARVGIPVRESCTPLRFKAAWSTWDHPVITCECCSEMPDESSAGPAMRLPFWLRHRSGLWGSGVTWPSLGNASVGKLACMSSASVASSFSSIPRIATQYVMPPCRTPRVSHVPRIGVAIKHVTACPLQTTLRRLCCP